MKNSIVSLLLATLSLTAGCAGMNKSECLNADWRMIGFEDGSAGRAVAYIGEHRQACAPHNVTPDLDAYTAGHDEGIRVFCAEGNGFRFGHAGGTYSGVCPAELEPAFLAAYRAGWELHAAEQAVQQIRATITGYQNQIDNATKLLATKEKQLIQEGNTEELRRQLLDEMEQLRQQIASATQALADTETALPSSEQALENLRQSIDY